MSHKDLSPPLLLPQRALADCMFPERRRKSSTLGKVDWKFPFHWKPFLSALPSGPRRLVDGVSWWSCSVAQSCLTLCDPMDCSMPGFPVLHHLLELKLMSIQLVMPSNHLILCHPLLLLPSIFPSISVFSNESALHIRWPKYWSFSFNISPSNEHPGHGRSYWPRTWGICSWLLQYYTAT